jgi:hypothetical protein
MLWSKQYYYFDLEKWLREHKSHPLIELPRPNVRNTEWFHMLNADVISMPDKWEYPWYAAWDLAFHMIPFAEIDPEFAFFGPIGHDVGTYLANLVIGYAAQEFHCRDAGQRSSYRQWLLESFRQTWSCFEAELLRLWEKEGNADWPSRSFRKGYLRQLLQDTAGFGGAEIMRAWPLTFF